MSPKSQNIVTPKETSPNVTCYVTWRLYSYVPGYPPNLTYNIFFQIILRPDHGFHTAAGYVS